MNPPVSRHGLGIGFMCVRRRQHLDVSVEYSRLVYVISCRLLRDDRDV